MYATMCVLLFSCARCELYPDNCAPQDVSHVGDKLLSIRHPLLLHVLRNKKKAREVPMILRSRWIDGTWDVRDANVNGFSHANSSFPTARSGVYTKLPLLERLMRIKSWNVASSLPCAKQEKYLISFGWSIIFVVSAKKKLELFSVYKFLFWILPLQQNSNKREIKVEEESERQRERVITPVSFLEPPQVLEWLNKCNGFVRIIPVSSFEKQARKQTSWSCRICIVNLNQVSGRRVETPANLVFLLLLELVSWSPTLTHTYRWVVLEKRVEQVSHWWWGLALLDVEHVYRYSIERCDVMTVRRIRARH